MKSFDNSISSIDSELSFELPPKQTCDQHRCTKNLSYMKGSNNSMSSIDSDWSYELRARPRPYVSTLLCGRERLVISTAQTPRRVEEGIVYRMLKEKGSTHAEAYKRQKLVIDRTASLRLLASTGSMGSRCDEKTNDEQDSTQILPPS